MPGRDFFEELQARHPGRYQIPYAYEAGTEPRLQAPLCAAQAGSTLHASTHVEGGDRSRRERLIKYILRPPLAAERLEPVEGGRLTAIASSSK